MADERGELTAFCVVASVAAETAYGEGGLELRRGVRHFAVGARVWVLPPQWGDGGDQLIVAGHHRGAWGRGLARMVVSRRHLSGFRVRGIYSPAVLRALTRPLTEFGWDRPPRLWDGKDEAEDTAARWRDLPLTACAADGPRSFITAVADPPLELTRHGRTYYLAHFNAHRVVYSPQPPPAEPPVRG